MTHHVHHVSCATMCPAAAKVPGLMPPRMVAHCLVLEGADGLTLVDTGFGTDDVHEGGKRLGRTFVALVGARFDARETAVARIRELGFAPRDVRDIVVTHLDLDHAGGLPDFPHARVHVHARELEAALHPSLRERQRYIAAQWAHGPNWVEHPEGGESWYGFEGVTAISDDVLLVPLHGHTRGHSGVAVRRPGGGWLLHAGDAYFHTGDKETPRTCPPGLRMFQAALAADSGQRKANLARLQELHAGHADEVQVFSAHDLTEFESFRSLAG